MIYQLVVHLVRPGTVPGYLERLQAIGRPARERAGAELCAVWTSCSGQLHEVWKLWAYPDAQRMRAVNEAMAHDPQWQAYMGPPTLAVLLESRRMTLQGRGDLATVTRAGHAAATLFRFEQPVGADALPVHPPTPQAAMLVDAENSLALLALQPLTDGGTPGGAPEGLAAWRPTPDPEPQAWGIVPPVRTVQAVTLRRVALPAAA